MRLFQNICKMIFKAPKNCATCKFKKYNGIFWECGLESTRMSSVDITYDDKPFSYLPEWCKLSQFVKEDI